MIYGNFEGRQRAYLRIQKVKFYYTTKTKTKYEITWNYNFEVKFFKEKHFFLLISIFQVALESKNEIKITKHIFILFLKNKIKI